MKFNFKGYAFGYVCTVNGNTETYNNFTYYCSMLFEQYGIVFTTNYDNSNTGFLICPIDSEIPNIEVYKTIINNAYNNFTNNY